MNYVDRAANQLVESNSDYRRLHDEHQQYKQRLTTIRQKTLPSEDDEIEMKRIKLHKLTLKDQMETIRSQHVLEHASA
jgi:uncharacterized protein YdcH (DUF465 family)